VGRRRCVRNPIGALSKPQAFAQRSQLKTWLIGILKHKVIDALRLHGREVSASSMTMTTTLIRWNTLDSKPTAISRRPRPIGATRSRT
jgi:DNA-directed RNA polymerase specialized sigma24 family protein